MIAVALLGYVRKHTHNQLQKLFAVYFKFHGLSAQAFSTAHTLGLTMSMKWTTKSVGALAASATKDMLALRDNCSWLMSHDNLNLAFQVYSQRINNQTHFDSGTAGTIYFKTNEEIAHTNLPKMLQEKRAEGLKTPITSQELLLMEMKALQKLEPYLFYEILQALLESPEFNLPRYEFRDDQVLTRPEPLQALPFGYDYPARQFLLATVKMEEASYKGNNQLIREWMQQMKMYSLKERKKTASERVIMFVGDQLTTDRMHSLQHMQAEDYNSFDWYDFLLPLSAWLHTSMAHTHSLHRQYLGTPATRGLNHAMILLK